MAYTYEDFLKKAKDTGTLGQFDNGDLELSKAYPDYGISRAGLMSDYNGATTEAQRALATEAAEQLRKSYIDRQTRDQQSNGYRSIYTDALDELLDKSVNTPSFSYDEKTDPSYAAYRKSYLREGERASANALAQAAATTGGRASSYAVSAAEQAGDYYAAQLSDKLPTLYQQAYERYLQDYQQGLSKLNSVREQDNTDYARYLDQLNLDYQKTRDRETDRQQELANAMSLYQLLGDNASDEVKRTLGLLPTLPTAAADMSAYGWSGGMSSMTGGTEDAARLRSVQDAWERLNDGTGGEADKDLLIEAGVFRQPDVINWFNSVYPGNRIDPSTEAGQYAIAWAYQQEASPEVRTAIGGKLAAISEALTAALTPAPTAAGGDMWGYGSSVHNPGYFDPFTGYGIGSSSGGGSSGMTDATIVKYGLDNGLSGREIVEIAKQENPDGNIARGAGAL